MNWIRLLNHSGMFCGALLINVFLFMGVAALCQDNAPDLEIQVLNPIHLASDAYSMPSKSAVTEQQQPTRPEAPTPDRKIPQMPSFFEPKIPPSPDTDIEIPECQYEITPDLVAARIPLPARKPKLKLKQKRRSIKERKTPVKDSTAVTATAASLDATTATGTVSNEPGETAGDFSSGDTGPREFGLGEVDRGPQILERQKPSYPLLARRRNLSGKVTVKFLVDRHGNVCKPKILEAHPKGVFDQSVLDSITQWRFKPGVYKGREVATWVVLPIQFRLTGS